jgi:hypothetical protein
MTETAVEQTEAPTPRPQDVCGKCGTVLENEQDVYWHQRRDSAGCIRHVVGMVLDLHERLGVIEEVFKRAAATAPVEGKDVTP